MEHYRKWDRGDWEEEQIYREQGGGRPEKRREKLKYKKQVRAHPTYVKYVCP